MKLHRKVRKKRFNEGKYQEIARFYGISVRKARKLFPKQRLHNNRAVSARKKKSLLQVIELNNGSSVVIKHRRA